MSEERKRESEMSATEDPDDDVGFQVEASQAS